MILSPKKKNNNKLKLPRLLELLRQETDEQHPMTTEMICQRLSENGIGCERRTLALDIQALNDAGYEVMCVRAGHSKAYYVEDRHFSLPELKILIDAVQAANFISEKKTAELMEKLANLSGGHNAADTTVGGSSRYTSKYPFSGLLVCGICGSRLRRHVRTVGTRAYNRCKICGRPHAYLRNYGICRICFRELAYKGQIPGVRKASF